MVLDYWIFVDIVQQQLVYMDILVGIVCFLEIVTIQEIVIVMVIY